MAYSKSVIASFEDIGSAVDLLQQCYPCTSHPDVHAEHCRPGLFGLSAPLLNNRAFDHRVTMVTAAELARLRKFGDSLKTDDKHVFQALYERLEKGPDYVFESPVRQSSGSILSDPQPCWLM